MASLAELRKNRLEKLKGLRARKLDPYPSQAERTYTAAELKDGFDRLSKSKRKIFLSGRLRGLRRHGRAGFIDLEDATGRFQIFLEEEKLGREIYDIFSKFADIGDFIEVSGSLFKTKKEEPTLRGETFRIIVKSLRPIPEDFYGLEDTEERLRKRYLDFLVNTEARKVIRARAQIVKKIREILDGEGFLEVETPILQTLAGGAAAEPFKTYFNIYNTDVYLRIAPELYLKRLLVGGFEGIYELGRNFRNEGVDREHNPEFTMLELYVAYKDYEWMMDLMEGLMRSVVKEINGGTKFTYGRHKIGVSRAFERKAFSDVLNEAAGVSWEDSLERLKEKAGKLGLEYDRKISKGKLADEIYKKICRPKIIKPTFVTTIPVEISPLAKRGVAPDGYTERFQLIVGGTEIMNGFSELNDPLDQRERFAAQEKLRRAGDKEAHPIDESFLEALEHGMPPAAGVGVGVDRLVALLTNQPSIRDVITFPFVKPKKRQ